MSWKSAIGLGAGILVVVALGLVVREALKPPASQHGTKRNTPLTDVVSDRPAPVLLPVEPAVSGSAPQPEVNPPDPIEPEDLPDPANPPQWTKPLATPSAPVPPDPFVPPPIEVDPDRGRKPPNP